MNREMTTGFKRLLVVDDAVANRQLLMNLLTSQGYRVHPASDGELALEFVQTTLPDLILLDIRMPGMDGYEVCRRLKADERTRAIPIIFISILEDERDKVKGFQAGGVDYITKPFQPEEVLARIQTHLRLRELTEQLEYKVMERTEDLTIANERLQREIAERKRAEKLIRASLAEKEVLLREIHHRVKNNLQVISSLLFLQSQKFAEKELKACFLESQSRICSMSLAHEQLYQSKSLAEVSVTIYMENLVGQLREIFYTTGQNVSCQLSVEDISLDIEKVIPCGLLITELLSNAYKHAFVDGRKGTIGISMKDSGKEIMLEVADDGVGLPAEVDYRQPRTLGFQLVTALVNQLNGTLELDRSNGTLFRVRFVDYPLSHRS